MIRSRYPLSIPGYRAASPRFEPIRSPYSGDLVAEVEMADAAGLQRTLSVAQSCFHASDRRLPPYERSRILYRLSELIDAERDKLALLIAREGGKPLIDAKVEVARAMTTVRLAAEESTRIHGEEIPMGGSVAADGRLAFTIREPIGVVAAISAFNHPLNLIVHQVAPAIAAGCPVIIKPATATPISAIVCVDLLREAGLPPDWAIALPCKSDLAEALATSAEIAFLDFIGSANVGWSLRSKLAPGVRCSLEHGGVAPVIVDESAGLERVVPALVKGGYYHAGQVCVSVQRIFVHHRLKDTLLARLAQSVSALKVGDPANPETEVGPLIRAAEVVRVDAWVREAIAAGARLICGGKILDHQCYAPTLLADVPETTRLMTEEVFGPVVCVNAFDDLPEAIARANGIRWSFQSAIFTQDVDRALAAAKALNASSVMINNHTAFRVDWMPFGGRGPSGLGVGGVSHSIRERTQEKLIVFHV